ILISLAILIFTSCKGEDPISNSIKTPGSLAVNATTSSYSGQYAPHHVAAIWIESSTGTFVKTLLVKATQRKVYLTNWLKATSTGNSIDASTGATLSNHGVLTCTWNGKDVNGNVVGDGSYNVCVEFTESNGTGKNASFAFAKGLTTDNQSPASKSNISGVSINWTPTPTH
ncbi:MAG: DUF2271 domain-containing protein, partial [Paludibacter sp.]